MTEQTGSKALGYFLLATGTAILLGVTGYFLGFLSFVYHIMMPNAFTRFDLFALAAITGLAAFFSPCAFPVLPSYVAYTLTSVRKRERGHRLRQGLYLGGAAALGLTAVNLAVGVAIAVSGEALFQPDPRLDHPLILAMRIAAGLAIAGLGAATIVHHSFSIGAVIASRLSRRSSGREVRPYWDTLLYGMLYNGVGIGCTGPILLSLVLYALTVGSFIAAITGFIVFSLTMAASMLIITSLVALSRVTMIDILAKVSPKINRLSGLVMMIVGILTVALTGNELFTRIFFPFLPGRDFTTGEILWLGITLGSLPLLTGYVVLRRR